MYLSRRRAHLSTGPTERVLAIVKSTPGQFVSPICESLEGSKSRKQTLNVGIEFMEGNKLVMKSSDAYRVRVGFGHEMSVCLIKVILHHSPLFARSNGTLTKRHKKLQKMGRWARSQTFQAFFQDSTPVCHGNKAFEVEG